VTDAEHCYHAVACAVLMQRLIGRINAEREKEGVPPVQVRIGINSGEMLAGLVGSQQRMEYTVVGDSVNLASRLCNEAQGAQIIIEENLYQNLVGQHNISVAMPRQIKVRGKSEPITIYTVTDIEHRHPLVVEQMIDDVLHHREAS
jgi:adenylate cyclase